MFTLFNNFSKRWKMLRDNITKVSDKNSIEKLPKRWMRVTRFTLLAYDKFEEKRCFMRAAALSFNSLLALIPVLALTVSLTSWIIKDTGTQSLEKLVNKIIVIIMPANSSNKDIEAITESLGGQITQFIKNLNEQIQSIMLVLFHFFCSPTLVFEWSCKWKMRLTSFGTFLIQGLYICKY